MDQHTPMDPYTKAARLVISYLSKKELSYVVSVMDGDCDDVVFSALVEEDRKNFPDLYTNRDPHTAPKRKHP